METTVTEGSGPSLKEQVRRRLLEERDPEFVGSSTAEKRVKLREAIMRVIDEERFIVSGVAVASLVREITDEVLGLGPLEELLRDSRVTEVMINNPDNIYVEVDGRIERSAIRLNSEEQIHHLIDG